MRQESKESETMVEETKQFDQRFNTGKNRMFELNVNRGESNFEYPPVSMKEVPSESMKFSRKLPTAEKFNYRLDGGDSIKDARLSGKKSLQAMMDRAANKQRF